MEVTKDGTGQPMIEWEQGPGRWTRAWIQRRTLPEKDWAKTGRYLNVVWANGTGKTMGNPTDFPIYEGCALSDEQILTSFVATVCGITGCKIK
jgi:hypothetical protein